MKAKVGDRVRRRENEEGNVTHQMGQKKANLFKTVISVGNA